MKPLLLIFALASVSSAFADGAWLSSMDEAAKVSKQSGRPIMALFTGSDWCAPCNALESRVLATPVFKQWAKGHVVLVKFDFPQHHPQPAALQKSNQDLAGRFNVDAFPTVLFISPNGQVLGRERGFNPAGPSFWTKNAEIVMQRH